MKPDQNTDPVFVFQRVFQEALLTQPEMLDGVRVRGNFAFWMTLGKTEKVSLAIIESRRAIRVSTFVEHLLFPSLDPGKHL
jgi:hypothetical protein